MSEACYGEYSKAAWINEIPAITRSALFDFFSFLNMSLTHLIRNQLNRFIEVTAGREHRLHDEEIIRQSLSSLSISFLTKTIYTIPAAHIITASLKHKLNLADNLTDDITNALHEAILNCVVHGNLEIDNDFSDQVSFGEYYDTIDERLNNELYASRRVNIHIIWTDSQITIAVTDEGGKNRMISAYCCGHHTKHLNGRGIHIIESCSSHISWSKDGRTLTMVFLR